MDRLVGTEAPLAKSRARAAFPRAMWYEMSAVEAFTAVRNSGSDDFSPTACISALQDERADD